MTWQNAALGDLCEINVGKTPSRANKNYWSNGTEPWLSIADMTKGYLVTETKERITKEAVASCNCKIALAGTVLMSFKLSVGKVSLATFPVYTNEAIAALPIKNKSILCEEFLAYALKNIDLQSSTDRAAMGLTLNKDKLKRIKIPLPPLPQQKRIAAILDKAEEIKIKREQAIVKLNEVIGRIFDDVQRSAGFENVSTIRDLTTKVNHTVTADKNVWSLSLEQIDANAGSINNYVMVDRNQLGSSTYFFSPPVVLYSKLRPYLNKVALPEKSGFATTELVPLYCNESKVLPEYLATYLRSAKFVEFANTNSAGAKMPRVMMDKFWQHQISLPNISKQLKFVEAYRQCKKQIEVHEKAVVALDTLLASLQHQAFTTGFNA